MTTPIDVKVNDSRAEVNSPLEIALSLIKRFEGVYLSPYLCPAGIATIGVGATYYENGARVQLTDPPITRARAEALLQQNKKVTAVIVVLRERQ